LFDKKRYISRRGYFIFGSEMMERSLPVSSGVYDAVIELQKSLIDEYGDDVTISDTIDFLGKPVLHTPEAPGHSERSA
jgi:hypothetical protein